MRAQLATCVVVLSCLLGSNTIQAQATRPDDSAIEKRIDQLEAEVHHLRTELRASHDREVQATAEALNQESQRSTGITTSGFTAGYVPDRGFIIQSSDSSFLLHPWIQLQVRGVVNSRKAEASWDDQSGFEIRRMYFAADGNAFSKDLNYFFIWAADRHTGTPTTLDAWVAYHLPSSNFTIKAGQFLNPLDHEQLTFSRFQMAAERSLTSDVFNSGDDYVQGVQLGFDNGHDYRSYFAVTDGFNNNNKNFEDYPATKANFGFAGRMECKATGNWVDYHDFTALGDTEPLLVFGAGADYTEAGHIDALRHVIDATYESPCGFSAFAAYMGRYTRHGGLAGQDTYDPSVRVQAAKLITARLEPFVRYGYFHLDGAELSAGSKGNVHEITAGANYYFSAHRAKLTIDVTYLPTGSPVSDDGSDTLSTGAAGVGELTHGGGSEFIVRAQFQLIL